MERRFSSSIGLPAGGKLNFGSPGRSVSFGACRSPQRAWQPGEPFKMNEKYQEYLQGEKWLQRRIGCLIKYGHECAACERKGGLQIHHLTSNARLSGGRNYYRHWMMCKKCGQKILQNSC